MDKKKFDKIMDDWVVHEMEAAPDLQPSPEVYQKLEEKRKKPRFSLFSWPVRLAAAGIAATLITLVIVMQPPKEVEPFLGLRKEAVEELAKQEVNQDRIHALGETETEEPVEEVIEPETAKIQKRVEEGVKQEVKKEIELGEPPEKTKIKDKVVKVKEADKEVFVQPKEAAARQRIELKPEKKEGKSQVKTSRIAAVAPAAPAQIVTERVEFQYQPKGTEAIKGLDFDSPQDEIISLSAEDNYRLSLELPQDRYVYVFQVGTEEQPIKLFPNPEFTPDMNPIQAGKSTTIPLPPNWLYVEKDQGEVLLYVVTSTEPLQDWDDIDAKIAKGSLDQMKKDRGDKVSVRVFIFTVHCPH